LKNSSYILKKESFYKFVASGFGIGEINYVPQLWASIFALIVAVVLKQLPFAEVSLFLIILTTILVGSYCAQKFITQEPKPTWIVVDEMVGTWVALYFFSESSLLNLFAFATYQLLNFCKPLIKINEKGKFKKWFKFVMLDDIVAGVFSNVLVYAILLTIVEVK
jgi:phosphatidylglycerophosphatase A